MKYSVEIFDARGNIPNITFLNSFYKKNVWKDFWNLINFKRKEYPTYFIIQNIDELREKNERIGEIIDDLIILYNHKMSKNHFILYDFYKNLSPNQFNSIFIDSPAPFEYRGDPELWEELSEYFKESSFPENENELVDLIENAIVNLTGKSIRENESYFVEKYHHGSGMSGGIINSKFWLYRAIPILIGRYRRIKNLINT